MADKVVPISRLLDERGLSSFQIKLLIWSFFIVLIDGYDITAIAFAAPSLVKEWSLKPGALGPVFSASLIGLGESAFWRLHACGRLLNQSRPDVLAAAAGGPWHRRRYSQCGRHQYGVRATQIARHACDYRCWVRTTWRRHSGFCGRRARAAIWLADPVSDWRHRANRHCYRCADRDAGIDQ